MSIPVPNRQLEARTLTGYNGTCTTRQLTPDELARYGPPIPRKRGRAVTAKRYLEVIATSANDVEAAAKLGMTVSRLRMELTSRGINSPKWGG